jgi:hypothetical protein
MDETHLRAHRPAPGVPNGHSPTNKVAYGGAYGGPQLGLQNARQAKMDPDLRLLCAPLGPDQPPYLTYFLVGVGPC